MVYSKKLLAESTVKIVCCIVWKHKSPSFSSESFVCANKKHKNANKSKIYGLNVSDKKRQHFFLKA